MFFILYFGLFSRFYSLFHFCFVSHSLQKKMWSIVYKSSKILSISSKTSLFSLKCFSTCINDAYSKLLEEGKILKDPNQSSVVYYLSRLENALRDYQRPPLPEVFFVFLELCFISFFSTLQTCE